MIDKNTNVMIVNDYNSLKENLCNIKKDSLNNILYTNCLVKLNVSKAIINMNCFDTVLHSLDNNTMIVFDRRKNMSVEEIKLHLNKNNIEYNEVAFYSDFSDGDLQPEIDIQKIVLVNSCKSILEELKDTLENRHSNKCSYYPDINGNLSFLYNIQKDIYDEDYHNIENQLIRMGGLKIKGVITTCDKAILLIDPVKYKYSDKIFKTIKEIGFKHYVYYYSKPKFISEIKAYNKKIMVKK